MSFLTQFTGAGTDSRSGNLGVVPELQAMSVEVDYSVMRFGPRCWGIRGHIAYDGDVLAAVFASEHDAWVALSPVRPNHG